MKGQCFACKQTEERPLTVEVTNDLAQVIWRITLCWACFEGWAANVEGSNQ